MEVDPETTVGQLLRAIPSSLAAFQNLDIPVSAVHEKTLLTICAENGIRLHDLLQAIEDLDWNGEGGHRAEATE